MISGDKTHVLFVCMGNICRSPTAEAVFRSRAARAGLEARLVIDSAGTHASHAGDAPDARAIAVARTRGYDLSEIRSRPITRADFGRFDYVLGMDNYNLKLLRAMAPAGFAGYLGRLLDFAPHLGVEEIDDPYYGDARQFDMVLAQIEAGADGLLSEISTGVRRAGERRDP
ncbi:MAG: low molecular weight protein-tyrosine-phosphatase [Betaproteobacteria bacterium]